MRPEYLQALDEARWNYWFLAMLSVPAILTLASTSSWKLGFVNLPFAIFFCWLFLSLGVDHYWEVKRQLAETAAESADAAADTGRLFGPIIVGIPFAVVYCTLLLLFMHGIAWSVRLAYRLRNRGSDTHRTAEK